MESPQLPQPLIPPLRFAAVHPQIYRGAYPRQMNLRFLQRHRIRTVVSLIPQAVSAETDIALWHYAQANGVRLVHIPVGRVGKGKKRGVPLSREAVAAALAACLEADSVPVYLHCLNGGHVTSLVVACLRRLLSWSSASIFSEFIAYSDSVNVADRSFVESFTAEIAVAENYTLTVCNQLTNRIIYNNPNIRIVLKDKTKDEKLGKESNAQISSGDDRSHLGTVDTCAV